MAFVLLGTLPLVSRASAKTKITENTLRSDEQPEKDGTDLSDEDVPLDDSGTETGDSLDSEAAKDEVFTQQEHIEESKIAIAEKNGSRSAAQPGRVYRSTGRSATLGGKHTGASRSRNL